MHYKNWEGIHKNMSGRNTSAIDPSFQLKGYHFIQEYLACSNCFLVSNVDQFSTQNMLCVYLHYKGLFWKRRSSSYNLQTRRVHTAAETSSWSQKYPLRYQSQGSPPLQKLDTRYAIHSNIYAPVSVSCSFLNLSSTRWINDLSKRREEYFITFVRYRVVRDIFLQPL